MLRLLYFFTFISLSLTTSIAQSVDLSIEQYVNGIFRPVDIANAGDDRLFIVSQGGTIHIVEDGSLVSTPFLDIGFKVNTQNSEQGLLGLVFHPDYANNGFFYIYYTAGGGAGTSTISRYSVDPSNPNLADDDSESIVMTLSQPFWNHNAGDLAFGPDGYLYISFGDGGGGNDPLDYAQNPDVFFGKMLRIDVDNGNPYSVPADNPFVNNPDVRDEIWSLGLRNVWRYSFDRLTGDLWMADVGQNAWEEINFQPAESGGGENYQWDCLEGTNNAPGTCFDNGISTGPVHEYSHGGNGCSITGGFVYRGCNYPDLYGKYVYSDYCSGRIWALTPDGNGGFDNEFLRQYNQHDWSSLGEDVNGELYIARLNTGTIYRIVTAEGISPFNFDVSGSTLSIDPDFDTYQWYLNGALINGATANTYEATESGVYTVEVTTDQGCTFLSEETNVTIVNSLEARFIESWSIQPNPVETTALLQIQLKEPKAFQVTLRDLSGKNLWNQSYQALLQEQVELPMNDLPNGIYLVELAIDGNQFSRKVVKE